ncbi:LTA synthase family protein [Sedimentitalea todarodis]|uniref:Sulfatase-like protein n=1 Tax=Sedimentitalea todarodis TaxID=1631240 RepID=A0ABU3VDW7_9RHOB|nr:sulfatase-like protein [Sedimentitalea todarodis]MDU9004371.1 sulfatase-like protein [Sedimentitalea todarodis]
MRRLALLSVAATLLFGALAFPNHPHTLTFSAFTEFPLELPVLLGFMLAVGYQKGSRRLLPPLAAAVLLVAVFIKLADIAMFLAYDRTFNPLLDAFLIGAGTNLLRDSIGTFGVVLAWMGGILGLIGLFLALWWALRQSARATINTLVRITAGAIALTFAALTVADAGDNLDWWELPQDIPGTSITTSLVMKRGIDVAATAAELTTFAAQAAHDPYDDAHGLFDIVGDRDVLIIFIESYGRTSVDNPLYAPTHLPTLRSAETAIADAGLAMRSGWLSSPTAGGQSWLAHGAVFSGLWTTDQGRYAAMLTSGRRTLFHLAAEAGFRTAAVMPAITIAWPESSLMGFETVLESADMAYDGTDFGWVTMPDQYTLATFPDLLGPDPRRDFVQIALISSHAPWTPVPQMVAWDTAADGAIYDEMATAGPAPGVVWKTHDTVRDFYRRSIDYALRAATGFAARQGQNAPLILILGDHPPAGFVSQIDGTDVPAHLIGPADLLARIDGWGWSTGMIPAAGVPSIRMDGFRDRFIAAFSSQEEQ